MIEKKASSEIPKPTKESLFRNYRYAKRIMASLPQGSSTWMKYREQAREEAKRLAELYHFDVNKMADIDAI